MAASDPTDVPSAAPAERVDALYGLPLDEFTPARDALAKELRQDGRREEATWVKGLKRPSAAAWLVNQLARTQPRDARRLLAADEALRKANERVLSGKGSAGELGKAGEEHSAAIRDLLAKAPGLLDRQGRSPSGATLEKAEQTLRSIALDDDVRRQFELGRLTSEQQATGFGEFAGPLAPPRRAATPRPVRRRTADRGPLTAEPEPEAGPSRAEQRAAAREALKAARAELRERKRAVTEAERELRDATRAAERAQKAAEQAEGALARARAAEDEAAARVAEAEAEAR